MTSRISTYIHRDVGYLPGCGSHGSLRRRSKAANQALATLLENNSRGGKATRYRFEFRACQSNSTPAAAAKSVHHR